MSGAAKIISVLVGMMGATTLWTVVFMVGAKHREERAAMSWDLLIRSHVDKMMRAGIDGLEAQARLWIDSGVKAHDLTIVHRQGDDPMNDLVIPKRWLEYPEFRAVLARITK